MDRILRPAVQEDYRETRSVQQLHHPCVDLRARRAEFQRRKEHAGHRAGNTVASQFQRLFLAALRLVGVRPQQPVAARFRSRRNALADGLKDLRFAEVGNHQAEQQAFLEPLGRAAHVGARAGHAVQQTALLQLADCAPHGDPGCAEALHQRGFAGEFLSRRVPASDDIALQAFAYLPVHRLGGNCLLHDKAVISAL